MTTRIAFIRTHSGALSLTIDGKPYPPIAKDHLNYEQIKVALKDGDADRLKQLCDVPKSVTNFMPQSGIEVRDGVVYRNGKELHNAVTKRILEFIQEGLPHEPLLLFLTRLLENTDYRAVQESYDFLEHGELPLTEDGCFLAYS